MEEVFAAHTFAVNAAACRAIGLKLKLDLVRRNFLLFDGDTTICEDGSIRYIEGFLDGYTEGLSKKKRADFYNAYEAATNEIEAD